MGKIYGILFFFIELVILVIMELVLDFSDNYF